METGQDVDREATRYGGLGCGSIPIFVFKDRCVVCPHVMLNASLSLIWPDNSFPPRSRVAQLRP